MSPAPLQAAGVALLIPDHSQGSREVRGTMEVHNFDWCPDHRAPVLYLKSFEEHDAVLKDIYGPEYNKAGSPAIPPIVTIFQTLEQQERLIEAKRRSEVHAADMTNEAKRKARLALPYALDEWTSMEAKARTDLAAATNSLQSRAEDDLKGRKEDRERIGSCQERLEEAAMHLARITKELGEFLPPEPSVAPVAPTGLPPLQPAPELVTIGLHPNPPVVGDVVQPLAGAQTISETPLVPAEPTEPVAPPAIEANLELVPPAPKPEVSKSPGGRRRR